MIVRFIGIPGVIPRHLSVDIRRPVTPFSLSRSDYIFSYARIPDWVIDKSVTLFYYFSYADAGVKALAQLTE
jgi:hypothetical protein